MLRFLIICLLFPFCLIAQKERIDSIKSALLKLPVKEGGTFHDTLRCKLLGDLIAMEYDDAVWPVYNTEIIKICEKNLKRVTAKGTEYNWFVHHYSMALSNDAFFLKQRGNINKALEIFMKALSMQKEIGDMPGYANTLMNLGTIYDTQGEFDKALEFYLSAIDIYKKTNTKVGLTHAYNNIGVAYDRIKNTELATEYYEKCRVISVEIGNKDGEGFSMINLGANAEMKHDYAKALEYFTKSLAIFESIKNKRGIAGALNHIAGIYRKQKQYDKAEQTALKSISISRAGRFPDNIRDDARLLYNLYSDKNKMKEALEYYELYIQMRDSLNNESTRKTSIKTQLKYDYEKQAAADSVSHAKESEIKNVELAKQKVEIKVKRNQQYALFGGLALVCLFGLFMFKKFKETQFQKRIIEEQKLIVEDQKKIVEEKQREILDSIRYARRIQKAHLPSENYVSKSLIKLRKRT